MLLLYIVAIVIKEHTAKRIFSGTYRHLPRPILYDLPENNYLRHLVLLCLLFFFRNDFLLYLRLPPL